MEELSPIHIKIGEVKVGSGTDLLKTTLGSCVGIAFLWRKKNLYGLAHCLLPKAPTASFQIGAKYVDQAVSSLLSLMRLTPENFNEIEVYVAGGGNMVEQLSRRNKDHIGVQNSEAAKSALSALGLKIKEIDVGGVQGRQMTVDCATQQVAVRKIAASFSQRT